MSDTHLHIDRVVVTGVPGVHGYEAALQDAVAAELTRLVREEGLPSGLGDASRIARSVRVGAVTDARVLGADIAQAVYGSLGTAPSRSPTDHG